jgi:threonylcarbamoyladenosine tRNA methylthiotransferase MtaB
VVVNTCAVTEEAVRKSRKLMHRARRRNPNARLVVTGCYASLDSTLEGVDLVVPNRDKERLVEIAQQRLGLDWTPALAEPDANPLFARGRQRAFIKVQDGCRHQCTFCIVTLARGEERSRPAAEVIAEINRLHAEGVQEAVLAGVHLGGYGSDLRHRGSDLASLVRQVLAETAIPRLRLGAVEPWGLGDDFWALFDNPRLMPHLHLPLQSGSDAILRRMARRCKRAEFLALVAQARRSVADFNLTTDILVGFPGEGEADWRQTLELVEAIGFGHLHIFGFSPRPGTRAAELPDPIDPEVIRARSRELHALGERIKRQVLAGYVGRRLPVLIEGRHGDQGWAGYTPNFLRVILPEDGGEGRGHPTGPAVAGPRSGTPVDWRALQGPRGALENRILELEMRALHPTGEALLGACRT